ncbi:glycosyltransferase family 2 protein [Shewanella sp. HL-SH8]|uniref:glycosyltransferase family 2 protein n=1 Tax=Shewanella sp. HL-SH8 TaxID=3436242 RepID=UPI003EBABA6C
MREIISVAVICYKSSATVTDTLNSILVQNYGSKFIELIISDDCSNDNTIDVIERWIEVNQHQFHSVKLFSAKCNGGVAINCNIAWRNCSSDWIKTIAADDILTPNCISDNMSFINSNADASLIFSKMFSFTQDSKISKEMPYDIEFFSLNSSEQLEKLIKDCSLQAPSSFIRKSLLEDVGYAEEKYNMLEDYPLWFKILKMGTKISFLDKNTVLYRNADSLSQQVTKIGNVAYLNSLYSFQQDCLWPYYKGILVFKKWDDYIVNGSKLLWINNVSNVNSLFFKAFYKALFLIRPYLIWKLAHAIKCRIRVK